MLVTEKVEIFGRKFILTKSDSNKYIIRDGVKYSEAYDPAGFKRTYTESEDDIEAMGNNEPLKD